MLLYMLFKLILLITYNVLGLSYTLCYFFEIMEFGKNVVNKSYFKIFY